MVPLCSNPDADSGIWGIIGIILARSSEIVRNAIKKKIQDVP
jgi:hypothetical protein